MSALAILAVIAGIVGLIGSVVPALPGPPLSWVGLLLVYFAGGTNGEDEPMSLTFLLVWLGVTVLVSVLDYVVPMYFTRLSGGSKIAGRGAMAGMLVGLLLPPVGIILGSLLGAFLAEFIVADRGAWVSFKSSIGAFLGFLFGTGLKLVTSALMLYYTIIYL